MLLNLIKQQLPDIDKITYTSKVHCNQSVNCLSAEWKKLDVKNQKIKKHLFIIHKQLIMSVKIWKAIIQQRKKVLIVSNDMIVDMEANKKISPIFTE